jgi:adenylate kinase family enzyme
MQDNEFNCPYKAVLLTGPTGCGKSPLGQLLESVGLKGNKCLHFDFGRELRTVEIECPTWLTHREIEIIRRALKAGALLEDDHFTIAKKLLIQFVAERGANRDYFIVLNGMPRHVGQAKAINSMVDLSAVINLNCASAAVWGRVRTNAGGDRHERCDDTLEEVRMRLQIFGEKTVPMLEYYCRRGVPIINLDVAEKTTAEDMLRMLEIHRSLSGL